MALSVSSHDTAEVWGPVVVVLVLVLANLLAWALNERSWPFRHLLSKARVPKLVFISNRAPGVSQLSRPSRYWSFDLLDPHHLVQSPVLNTTGLLVLHAATFLYWVATVLVDVVVEYYGYGCTAHWCWRRSGAYTEWMTFLTNWSISILGLSGLVAFINTARYARQQRHWRKQQQQQQQQQGAGGDAVGAAAGGQVELGAVHQGVPGVQGVPVSLPTTQMTAAGGVRQDAVSPAQLGARDQVSPQQQQQQQERKYTTLSTVQAAGLLQQAMQREQQQQQEQEHAPAGAGGNSSSSGTSNSSSCDTVVVVEPGGSNGLSKGPPMQWDWLSRTHCLLSEVATTAAFFVSFWFWVGLVAIAGEFFRANGGTLMAHAGNFVIAALQLLLTRLPVVSTHFQVLLWYASAYEVFLWAYGGASGRWRYGLDWQKAKSAGALMLVPVIVFIFFCLWFLLARAREAFFTRLQRRRINRRQQQQQKVQQQQQLKAQHSAGSDAVV